MKIIQISRKVTGRNYSNIELIATLTANENIQDCAVELDKKCNEILSKIEKQNDEEFERENKKYEMLEKIKNLKKLIENGKIDDLPF
jgi:esterase/lipase